ncbi:MAG: hypothetical protein ACSHX8_00860 [Opitutaceae bacterium]
MKANVNPFRSSRVEQIRYALPAESLDALVEKALQQKCSCLLGPRGTGKTTLLEDLESRIQDRDYTTHWIRLNLESTQQERRDAIEQLSSFGKQDVCLFDGAEVLIFWKWRKIRRLAKQQGFHLIATLHKPRSVTVLVNTKPNWKLANTFVRQLAGDHCNLELIEQAKQSFDLGCGNMREVFRTCYLLLAKTK